MEEKEKRVRIRVDTVIRDATGEEETLSLETLGVSGIREETPYISYRETELFGLGIKLHFRVSNYVFT